MKWTLAAGNVTLTRNSYVTWHASLSFEIRVYALFLVLTFCKLQRPTCLETHTYR